MIGLCNTLVGHGLQSFPKMERVVHVVVCPREISTDPSIPVTMIVDRLELWSVCDQGNIELKRGGMMSVA
jgi:hypothetical protein